MSHYSRQLCVTAVTWFVWDVAATVQFKAVTGNWTEVAVFVTFSLPLIGFVSQYWWVELKSFWRRLGLTAAGACGAALGTYLVMTYW